MGVRGPAILPAEKRGVKFPYFHFFHKQGGLKAALFFSLISRPLGERKRWFSLLPRIVPISVTEGRPNPTRVPGPIDLSFEN